MKRELARREAYADFLESQYGSVYARHAYADTDADAEAAEHDGYEL